MNTILLEKKDIDKIVKALEKNEVIAFPTDTVYGVGVISSSKEACLKLKEAKKRPETKPFPMMVSNFRQIQEYAIVDKKTERIIKHFMPGALTIIFNKKPTVEDYVTNGYETIGIRMPNDPFVLEILERVQVPLLVPSANISGEQSATTHEEALAQLDGRIYGIVKGESGKKQSSTIIDVTTDDIKLIRQGEITLEEILDVVGGM